MSAADEIVPFGGPWVCFHCEEAFTDRQAAADHFGHPTDMEPPGCIAILTETEKAIVEDRREWKRRALAAEDEVEQVGYENHLLRWDTRATFKGAKSIPEVKMLFDTLEGDLRAARARIERVPRWVRRLFTPRGYYS